MTPRAFIAGCAALLSCAAAAQPVSVTDDTGTPVSLARPAQRIVSIAPSLAEVAFAAGEQRVSVAAPEFLVLRIECRQNRRATRVDVALRWRHQARIRGGDRGAVPSVAPQMDQHGR